MSPSGAGLAPVTEGPFCLQTATHQRFRSCWEMAVGGLSSLRWVPFQSLSDYISHSMKGPGLLCFYSHHVGLMPQG